MMSGKVTSFPGPSLTLVFDGLQYEMVKERLRVTEKEEMDSMKRREKVLRKEWKRKEGRMEGRKATV